MAEPSFWTELKEELRAKHPEWSSSTFNKVLAAGTTCMNFCNENGVSNVKAPRVRKEKQGEARHTYFTKEQVDELVFAAESFLGDQALADAILISAYTGLRQSELLEKLRVGDVDWEANTLWVGGRPGQETKGKEVRALPIHERVAPVLRRLIDNAPSSRNPLLFEGAFKNADQMRYKFERIRDNLGISDEHVWHSLRHSFGTWLGEATHPRTIQSLMGHKNIATTLRYVKATDKAMREALASI
jgi:integrase